MSCGVALVCHTICQTNAEEKKKTLTKIHSSFTGIMRMSGFFCTISWQELWFKFCPSPGPSVCVCGTLSSYCNMA